MILKVTGDGVGPLEVRATADALWWTEDTLGTAWNKASDWAIRLCLAYYGAHGKPEDPVDIKTVRAWGRDYSIEVTVDATANPTPPELSGAP